MIKEKSIKSLILQKKFMRIKAAKIMKFKEGFGLVEIIILLPVYVPVHS